MKVDKEQVKNVKPILICFEALLGLKVNFFKSELIGVRVGDDNIKMLADLFGCKVGQFPVSYLGMPLCLGHPKMEVWRPVVE